jgi:hypothetical protein
MFAALLAAASPPRQKTAIHAQGSEYQQAHATYAATAAPSVQAKKPPEYKRPCGKPKDAAESELCAQWEAADAAVQSVMWAERQTWLGVLGFLGLIATLVYTAKGTSAAIDAVEAQINADRPLMHLSNVIVRPAAAVHQDGTQYDIEVSWALANHGATGCWTENVCIRYAGHVPPEDLSDVVAEGRVMKLIAFVPPGKGISTNDAFHSISFDADEMEAIRKAKRLYVYGRSTYRDAGGRRWVTGFANWVDLNDDLTGGKLAFYPSDTHWTDTQIKTGKLRWPLKLKAKQAAKAA